MADNDNFLEMLRRQKLVTPDFNPEQEDTPTSAPMPSKSDELTNEYISQIQKAPAYKDYQPSFFRKLASGAMSINHPEEAATFRDRPYLNALRDYQVKTSGLGKAAEMENTLNVNRARISELTQRALMDAARASQERSTGKLREYEATPDYMDRRFGYKPQSLPEAIQLENAKHGYNRYQGFPNGLILDRVNGKYLSSDEFNRQMQDKEKRTQIEEGLLNVRRGQLGAYRERTGKMGTKGTKSTFPDSTHQATARKLAMEKLSADPRYSKFFAYGPDKKTLVIRPPSDGMIFHASTEDKKLYKQLLNRIDSESKRILGSDFTVENGDEEDNDYDIKPIEDDEE